MNMCDSYHINFSTSKQVQRSLISLITSLHLYMLFNLIKYQGCRTTLSTKAAYVLGPSPGSVCKMAIVKIVFKYVLRFFCKIG